MKTYEKRQKNDVLTAVLVGQEIRSHNMIGIHKFTFIGKYNLSMFYYPAHDKASFLPRNLFNLGSFIF